MYDDFFDDFTDEEQNIKDIECAVEIAEKLKGYGLNIEVYSNRVIVNGSEWYLNTCYDVYASLGLIETAVKKLKGEKHD